MIPIRLSPFIVVSCTLLLVCNKPLPTEHAPSGGRTTIAWDGTSKSGRTVSAGTYVIKARAGNWNATATLAVEK